jgi:uncharacterized protein with NAD-binding domain and iron-sulfur cluster
VDTGLHVVADHYANLIEVMGRLGATRRLRWFRKHLYLHTAREPLSWYFSPYKPPLHLLRPFFIMPAPVPARLGMALAGLRIASRTQAELAEFDDITYGEWHRRHRMGNGFLLELAEAGADAAAFLSADEAAARPVLSWMKYLMRNERAGDVGIWTGSLGECLVAPLVRAIEQRGGKVRTGTAALRLRHEGSRITGVDLAPSAVVGAFHASDGRVPLAEGGALEMLGCDFLVSALSVQGFQRVIGADLAREAGVSPALSLTTTPAMSLTVWFDRKIHPMPPGAPLVTGCAMRDLIDLETLGRTPAGAPGSVYQFVITHARQRERLSDQEIVNEAVTDLARIWPAAQGAQVVDFAVERVSAAMFAALPGAHRLRPTARTRIGNFFMAGDFTQHEANASMEGATLSGRLAADALLRSLGAPGIPVRQSPVPVGTEFLRVVRRGLKRLAPGPEATA